MKNPEYNRVVLAAIEKQEIDLVFYENCYLDENGWHLCDENNETVNKIILLGDDVIVDWTYAPNFVQLSFDISRTTNLLLESIAIFFIQLVTRFLRVLSR